VHSAVFGFDGVRISELAERTVRLAVSAEPDSRAVTSGMPVR
jgi:hypothetical protein